MVTYLEILGDIKDARQPHLVMNIPSHVPLSHGVHDQRTDCTGMALKTDMKVSHIDRHIRTIRFCRRLCECTVYMCVHACVGMHAHSGA